MGVKVNRSYLGTPDFMKAESGNRIQNIQTKIRKYLAMDHVLPDVIVRFK